MNTELNSVVLNQQAPEGKRDDKETLEVHSWFYTIQGEGPFAGYPAVFLRLAGCNLCCPLCDTNYTSYRWVFSHKEVIQRMQELVPEQVRCVLVITGGEPFRQQGIFKFINEATPFFTDIQIETNGTYSVGSYTPFGVSIVCSPKTPSVNQNVLARVGHWKYVMSAKNVDPIDGLPTSVLGSDIVPCRPPTHVLTKNVYLQPEYTSDLLQNQKNIAACVASCMKHGYRLCLQVQKICGLP